MSIWSRLVSQPSKSWGAEFVQKQLSTPGSLVDLLQRAGASTTRQAWRRASVRQAIGVPAINRAVTLISSTTGMLSLEAYRQGAKMPEPPRLIQRPDPYQTPRAFFTGTAANFAKYGEFVWWIAHRDTDNQTDALILVPLNELVVEENKNDRLRPRYTWGNITGTRYSGANPIGNFVHEKYPLAEPFALRGEGPLQLCGAANSVAVEAQDWAANFYGEGGHPATVIKKAGSLSPQKLDPTSWLPDPDPDSTTAMSEADLLRAQVIGRPNNTAMVIDDSIESIEFKSPNTVGAQMLDARSFQNGDAAREFGIPGSLLEYQQPGSSLTYQNLEGEFAKLVRVCLQPLYLEVIEQALSDLLTRSTVARFNVRGFQRPDAKTRWEIYQIMVAVLGQQEAAIQAGLGEGFIPGDVEYAPVPFAQPAAIPKLMSSNDGRCPKCSKRIAKVFGPGTELDCPRCKTAISIPVTEADPVLGLTAAVVTLANRPQSAPQVTFTEGAFRAGDVHVTTPDIKVESPVTVQPADVTISEGAFRSGDVHVAAPEAPVTNVAEGAFRLVEATPTVTVIDFDPQGEISGWHQEKVSA